MSERTWRCTECRHFVFPNYCAVKEINVDRNYDGYCDLAEELEEREADTPKELKKEEEKMSKLESIVPPPELCTQIPDGEFRDSALVWCRIRGENDVCPREQWVGVGGTRPIPAPTLEEILDEYCAIGADFCMSEFQIGNKSYCYPTGVEGALLLWFEIKGIEVE